MPEITDDEMGARLHAAGARWREATPVPTLPTDQSGDVDVTPEPHRPRRARTWIAAASGAALVAAAVVIGIAVTRGDSGSPQPAGQSELAGTSWQLSGFVLARGTEVPRTGHVTSNPDLGVALDFTANGRVSGSDGCNSFSGKVDIRSTQLAFGDLARTEMACPTTQPTADLVDRVFVGDVQWAISNGRLVLTKAGVGSLTYIPKPPASKSTDPKDLVGVRWGLSSVEHETADSGSASGSSDMNRIGLTFDGTGGFKVAEVCGHTTGHVSLNRGSITFSDRIDVGDKCAPLAAADPATLAALNQVLTGATTWSITDGTLTITKGSTKLTFTNHPSADQPAQSSDASPPATSLLGTAWLLADVNSPTFHQALDTTRTRLKLTIDAKGVFGIDDGVNFHSPENQQPIGISAEFIFVGRLTSTAAGCAPAGAQNCIRSNVVADFFAGTIGWAMHSGQLTLTKRATTLVYVRA